MSMTITRGLAVASVAAAVIGLWVAGPGPAHGEPSTVVRIVLKEYAFPRARVILSVGKPVTLRVVNRGRMTHTFTVGSRVLKTFSAEGLEQVRVEPAVGASHM